MLKFEENLGDLFCVCKFKHKDESSQKFRVLLGLIETGQKIIRKYFLERARILLNGGTVAETDEFCGKNEKVCKSPFFVITLSRAQDKILVVRVSYENGENVLRIVKPMLRNCIFNYNLTRCYGEGMSGGTPWSPHEPLYGYILTAIKNRAKQCFESTKNSSKKVTNLARFLNRRQITL